MESQAARRPRIPQRQPDLDDLFNDLIREISRIVIKVTDDLDAGNRPKFSFAPILQLLNAIRENAKRGQS